MGGACSRYWGAEKRIVRMEEPTRETWQKDNIKMGIKEILWDISPEGEIRRPERETNHSPPCGVEVQNTRSVTFMTSVSDTQACLPYLATVTNSGRCGSGWNRLYLGIWRGKIQYLRGSSVSGFKRKTFWTRIKGDETTDCMYWPTGAGWKASQ
jgi:hypothetical protein